MYSHPLLNRPCPFLGLVGDASLIRSEPNENHRCHAQSPPAEINEMHQERYCFGAKHLQCPFYQDNGAIAFGSSQNITKGDDELKRGGWLFAVIAAIILMITAVIYSRYFISFPSNTAATPIDIMTAFPPTTGETALLAPETPSKTSTPAPPTIIVPEPGDNHLILKPKSDEVGWWRSLETDTNHLSDSFLYAGYFEGEVFISAFRLSIDSIPEGTSIHDAFLELTGLNKERLKADGDGSWTVSLLQPDTTENFRSMDFQTLLNAHAAITLVPTLRESDLAPGKKNVWRFDPSALTWLEDQRSKEINEIIVRIVGPAGGKETLFAWDSGIGPATAGLGPKLFLNVGTASDTNAPTSTPSFIVATLTPTPQNVLTAAANALTATALSTRGAYTPSSINIVTPTPIPANLATVQANALRLGLPPVVLHTPTPANAATATVQSLYATAIAITTGTFTPVPTDAVTPIIFTPTPIPTDLAAFVSWALTATARPPIPSTPWPYNALVATPTLTPYYVTATPTPINAATASAQSFYATAMALTTGTCTPLPPNAIIIGARAAGTPTPGTFQVGQQVVIIADQRINMHSGPGIDFPPITTLNPGAIVTIAGSPHPTAQYTWWPVRFTSTSGEAMEGWVADSSISP